jgi:hypothetical protein
MDFIRLKLNDPFPGNSLGAVLYVNLRSNSIGGPVMATTASVSLSNAFTGVVEFHFPTSVQLTPGTTYYFEPVVGSGDLWNIDAEEFLYPRGSAFVAGLPVSGSDVWFREGVIVPEPSIGALVLLSVAGLLWNRRNKC